jgi:hypothetical protein
MSFISICFDKAGEHMVHHIVMQVCYVKSQRSTCYWNKFYEKSECESGLHWLRMGGGLCCK